MNLAPIFRKFFEGTITQEEFERLKGMFTKVLLSLDSNLRSSLVIPFTGERGTGYLSQEIIDDLFGYFCIRLKEKAGTLDNKVEINFQYFKRMVESFARDFSEENRDLLLIRSLEDLYSAKENGEKGDVEEMASVISGEESYLIDKAMLKDFINKLKETLSNREKEVFCSTVCELYKSYINNSRKRERKTDAEYKAFSRARGKFVELVKKHFGGEIYNLDEVHLVLLVGMILSDLCGFGGYLYKRQRPENERGK
ncbi:MAG: hypothetical protein ACPLN0_06700 [Candidatus Hydrothermia bacterium]